MLLVRLRCDFFVRSAAGETLFGPFRDATRTEYVGTVLRMRLRLRSRS
jgi:hypothetical protein